MPYPLHPPPPSPLLPPSVTVPKDQPILLADGDELGLGDVKLRVRLRLSTGAGGENVDENMNPHV